MGPADKITWVPHGNPFRDPSLISGWTLAGYPAGNLRVTRRVPAHGARVGPADKISRVPRGYPVRDPSLISGWDPCGLPGGQPAGYPPGTRTRAPCGPRGQNLTGPTRVSRAGPELDFRLGPLRFTRRVTCGLPAGYPHTGPVWAPRTKSHGSHAGIPCGTRIRDITGPVRDPGQCVGWEMCCLIVFF